MKRARIMLTALTIFTVVGGALAFKVKEFQKVYCTTSGSNVCTFTVTGKAITASGTQKVRCSTTNLAVQCPETFTTDVDND